MSAFFAAARERLPKGQDLIALVVIWTLLVSVPFWLPRSGGYTALASKVLVFGLAAMGLNMLLGFTGVLSFGHAAYFGLGAYGAGLTLRYLVHSTPLAMLAGTLFGGLAGTLFGMLIVRRRGVYFAMCTIAFGQLWYYLAYSWNDFTGGFDGLRDFHREPIGFGRFTFDITQGETRFYFFLLAIFAAAVGLMGYCCARRSAAPWSRSARTSAARASSASRWSGISGCRSRSPASSRRLPARSMRCSTISPTR